MNINVIEGLFKKHDGVMKTAELYDSGITKYELKKLLASNILERISKGYYKLENQEISDIGIVSKVVPGAVLCFDSALFHYDYSDRIPSAIHIAINKDVSKSKVKFDYPFVKAYFVEPFLLELGVEKTTIDDTEMLIYSRDRLICDCLFYENKMDIELLNKAIINYIKDPKKNISKLMEFAKIRKVEKKVYDRIGIWL